MPLGTAQITRSTADKFIPEVWLDEIRAFLKANLVVAKLIKIVYFQGKKGDVLHIPDLSEMAVNAKAANTAVTFQTFNETEFTVTIDRHQESSFMLEDLVDVQSKYDLRTGYTESAGYAIAKDVDTKVFALHATATTRVIGSNGSTTYNGTNGADITEAGIRQCVERLDTANVPSRDRAWVFHPAQKNVMLAIARFTEYQMVGNPGAMNPIQTGVFGEIYGDSVYFTTQAPVADTNYHANYYLQKNALLLAMQMSPRVQASYFLDFLGTGVVVDIVYKEAIYRQNHFNAVYTAVV